MSDFFYKERLGVTFSPVINVKKTEELPPAVLSALDNLLSPAGNMFTKAKTIKNLMQIQKMSLDDAANTLSLKRSDIANKLRLLEFSDKEKSAIIEYDFSENAALLFLNLDRTSRLYHIEYCYKSGFDEEKTGEYVQGIINSKPTKKKVSQTIRKIAVCDVGFLLNSIENALNLARKAGFEVVSERKETDTEHHIHIRVKKEKPKCKS